MALLVVISILGRPKGYLLKTYEKQNGHLELIKSIKSPMSYIYGVVYIVVSLIPAVGTYFNSIGLNYKDGHYVFGRVTGLSSGITVAVVISILFIALILVGNIVLRNIFVNKPLKPYNEVTVNK